MEIRCIPPHCSRVLHHHFVSGELEDTHFNADMRIFNEIHRRAGTHLLRVHRDQMKWRVDAEHVHWAENISNAVSTTVSTASAGTCPSFIHSLRRRRHAGLQHTFKSYINTHKTDVVSCFTSSYLHCSTTRCIALR